MRLKFDQLCTKLYNDVLNSLRKIEAALKRRGWVVGILYALISHNLMYIKHQEYERKSLKKNFFIALLQAPERML